MDVGAGSGVGVALVTWRGGVGGVDSPVGDFLLQCV